MDKKTMMENLAREAYEKGCFNGVWLYAENGGSFQNKNTSKSKVQKNLKDAQKAKETEWERQHAKVNESESEITGRIGKRTYARGRAYDPDRYNNTESAAEDAGDLQE